MSRSAFRRLEFIVYSHAGHACPQAVDFTADHSLKTDFLAKRENVCAVLTWSETPSLECSTCAHKTAVQAQEQHAGPTAHSCGYVETDARTYRLTYTQRAEAYWHRRQRH